VVGFQKSDYGRRLPHIKSTGGEARASVFLKHLVWAGCGRVLTAGQKRCITPQIKRDMRRRAAVEPVIGHLKEDHRMGRNYLAHPSGDAINAVLAAVGYNFRLLLRWLRLLLLRILIAIVDTFQFRFS